LITRSIKKDHFMLKQLLHNTLGYGCQIPSVRRTLTALHRIRHRHHPYMRAHPFDIAYGTATSGLLPSWLLRSGESADAYAHAYAGCQPSCLRRALSAIPKPEECSFIDLGCGKGRALIVASEYPFRRILGVELAQTLVEDALCNVQTIKQNYKERTAIEVVAGDATDFPLPDDNLVIFLYHSFGPELVTRMLTRILDAAAGKNRVMFFVYENPVYGELVDQLKQFSRWYCETVSCTASEMGFAPDPTDTVVVWRIGGACSVAPPKSATAPIIVTTPGWKAGLGTIWESTQTKPA
jgi:SAM-dependent methyltransferase